MREIAKEAGIALGGLYFHFESKDQLIRAVMERGSSIMYDGVVSALAVLPPTAKARERLDCAIQAYLTTTLENSEYVHALRFQHDQTLYSEEWGPYSVHRERHRQLWVGLVSDAQAEGALRKDIPARMIFYFILGALHCVPEWFDRSQWTSTHVIEGFTSMFHDGADA
jgi:AcrR family transcriptional regulator